MGGRPGPVRGSKVAGDARNGLYTPRAYVYRGTNFTTDDERAATRRAQAQMAASSPWKPGDPVGHGTPRGYQQHRRTGVPTCDACLAAHTARTAAYAQHRARGNAAGR